MKKYNSALFAPEFILESDGIACGDKLSIYAYRKNDCLYFDFRGKACGISNKTALWLVKQYSGQKEVDIYREIKQRKNMVIRKEKSFFDKIGVEINRCACVLAPINLLMGLFEQKSSRENEEKDSFSLACDACVSMKRVNWNSEIKRKDNIQYEQLLMKIANINEDDEKYVQQFGMCVLSENKQIDFQQFMKKLSSEQMKIVKSHRLAAPLYNNAEKYNLFIDPRIQELVMKQKVSTAVAESEIERINNFIKNHFLSIDAVKGGKTGKFYPSNHYRAHMDFDYLASGIKDASMLIDYMVNTRDFRFVIGGSVPFSFKSVLDENFNERLTGHIHLEKILQDQYQVVVDINIGGFPLGRTGIICPNKSGIVSVEDLICITTAHLFKHEFAFMKDINDLYYLLQYKGLDKKALCQRLKKFNLNNFFSIAYSFLKVNYKLEVFIDAFEDDNTLDIKQKDWPFSKKSHFYLKAEEMIKLCTQQYGEEKGRIEAKNQICGKVSENKSQKYELLCERLNTRTYLYPIVIFNKFIDVNTYFYFVDDCMEIYKNIVILPFGLFLMQSPFKENLMRENIENDIKIIMDKLSISERDCNFDYIMEARKDTWLY